MTQLGSSTSSRLDRKSLKGPDEFQKTTVGIIQKASSHGKLLLIGVGVVLAISAGIVAFNQHLSKVEDEAKDLLYLATTSLTEEMEKLNPKVEMDLKKLDKTAPKAKAPDVDPVPVQYRKLEVDTAFKGTVEKSNAVIEKFPKTNAAYQAHLLLGNLYVRHGHPKTAIQSFEKAYSLAKKPIDKVGAKLGEATAYENLGDSAKAIEVYTAASKLGVKEYLGEALMGLARSYTLAGKKDDAKGVYERIIKDLPKTAYEPTAKVLLDSLQ